MIEFKKVPKYQTPDGKEYNTLREAQQAEIETVIKEAIPADNLTALASHIIDHRDVLLAILKQKERVRTRKPKEGKKRGGKPAPATAPATT